MASPLGLADGCLSEMSGVWRKWPVKLGTLWIGGHTEPELNPVRVRENYAPEPTPRSPYLHPGIQTLTTW